MLDQLETEIASKVVQTCATQRPFHSLMLHHPYSALPLHISHLQCFFAKQGGKCVCYVFYYIHMCVCACACVCVRVRVRVLLQVCVCVRSFLIYLCVARVCG